MPSILHSIIFVQLTSFVQLCLTLCNPIDYSTQVSLFITNSQSLLKLMSIESVLPHNHLILCHPFLLLPSIFPASGYFLISQLFPSGGQSIGSFSFSISPSNEHPGLISSRMDWLDLLAGQGTLKILLQHHSSKVSIPQCSAFFKSNSHIRT